jgi:hypothetical protein
VHLSLYAQTTEDDGYTLDESDSPEEQLEHVDVILKLIFSWGRI